jgi:hypothetical protein
MGKRVRLPAKRVLIPKKANRWQPARGDRVYPDWDEDGDMFGTLQSVGEQQSMVRWDGFSADSALDNRHLRRAHVQTKHRETK